MPLARLTAEWFIKSEVVGRLGIPLHESAIAIGPFFGFLRHLALARKFPTRSVDRRAGFRWLGFIRGLKQCRHDSAESQQGKETKSRVHGVYP